MAGVWVRAERHRRWKWSLIYFFFPLFTTATTKAMCFIYKQCLLSADDVVFSCLRKTSLAHTTAACAFVF